MNKDRQMGKRNQILETNMAMRFLPSLLAQLEDPERSLADKEIEKFCFISRPGSTQQAVGHASAFL